MTALVASLGIIPMAIATGRQGRGAAAAGDRGDRRHRILDRLTLLALPALYVLFRREEKPAVAAWSSAQACSVEHRISNTIENCVQFWSQ